jgi:prevent-host-death family protein
MARRFETIVPITDLQSRSRELVEQVKKTGDPIVVTQRGRPAAMLVSFEAYEGHLATRDETSFPDWQARLRDAEGEIARRELVPHEEVARKAPPKRRRTRR